MARVSTLPKAGRFWEGRKGRLGKFDKARLVLVDPIPINGDAEAGALRNGNVAVAVDGVERVSIVFGKEVWRVTGGRPTDPPERVLALTTYPGIEAQPTFSPDGTQVAFSWDGERLDNEDIYVMVVGTDPPHRQAGSARTHPGPSTSPKFQHLSAGST